MLYEITTSAVLRKLGEIDQQTPASLAGNTTQLYQYRTVWAIQSATTPIIITCRGAQSCKDTTSSHAEAVPRQCNADGQSNFHDCICSC